ncbi:MAG: DUF21 domain-containing protein [Planctomycetes bacterium]|nr:DUF21 domain-containing protein [Planctomycetota bacterium]MCB9905396.1 DUF21 domain-containing protein [Planctomycetota bacterium]
MTSIVALLLAALFVVMEGFYSGCETGLYSLSRARLEVEARHGGRSARILLALVRRDAWVLITMLIGTTLGLELATWVLDHQLEQWGFGPGGRQTILALGLTPFAFYFGEALPKELYRRHPHRLMGTCGPGVLASLVIFSPLVLLLRGMTHLVERISGIVGERAVDGPQRAALLSVLDEGAGSGEITPHAVELARNALSLQSIPVRRAMVPWKDVRFLDADASDDDQRRAVEVTSHTRLPVCSAGAVTGYLHQLDVLAERSAGPVLAHRRAVPHLDPELSVHRALLRLRISGGRLAVVGPPEAPLGLVTLKDLLEEISGDLGDW